MAKRLSRQPLGPKGNCYMGGIMLGKASKEDILKEWDNLKRFEQQNYENFEKTILALSSALFAFSVSFLGLYTNRIVSTPGIKIINFGLLIGSWISFAITIILILLSMLFGGFAFRLEVKKIMKALNNKNEIINANNIWNTIIFRFYIISGIAFILGIILIIIFCASNKQLFSL
jgi:hypothetical protein